MVHYLDTSALMKLVLDERHSDALFRWVAEHPSHLATADLARAELIRAARRVDHALMPRVREILDGLTLIEVSGALFEEAGRLDPATLRSLDAIHLACALDLGDDLDTLVGYDDRLLEAGRAYGVRVLAPGRDDATDPTP